MRLLLLSLLAGLPALPALAQSSAPAALGSCWQFGGRLGASAFRWHQDGRSHEGQLIRPTAALNVGRYFGSTRLALHLELQAEQRYHYRQRPVYLLLPLYVRTGPPTALLHLVVGGGYGRRLGSAGPPILDEEQQPNEAFGKVGLEVGLSRRNAYRTATLGLYYHRGTAGYSYYRHSPGGAYYSDAKDIAQSLSLTLNYYVSR